MEAFPLQWPLAYKRTAHRIKSSFKKGMDQSQNFLRDELRRLGAKNLIVSTNIPVRKDGGMYAEYMARKIDDPGVAIYFKWNGKDVVMCCDRYISVWENVYALGKGIEAIRGMERWGVSDFIERAFSGFLAIEGPRKEEWYEILMVSKNAEVEQVKQQYRFLAMQNHPDRMGGNTAAFSRITEAYEQAKKHLNFV